MGESSTENILSNLEIAISLSKRKIGAFMSTDNCAVVLVLFVVTCCLQHSMLLVGAAQQDKNGAQNISEDSTFPGKLSVKGKNEIGSSVKSAEEIWFGGLIEENADRNNKNATRLVEDHDKDIFYGNLSSDNFWSYSDNLSLSALLLDSMQEGNTAEAKNDSQDLQEPQFEIRPHPQFPHIILQIFYTPSSYYEELRVNYSDFSYGTMPGSPPHSPPGSYRLTGDNPFNLHDLAPGHQYRFEFFGTPKNDPDGQKLLFSDVEMTDPKAPTFDTPESTTNSITLKGTKAPESLQDYFLVEYNMLDNGGEKYESLNVSDLAEQKKVELFLGNLKSGKTYNLSVTAHRLGRVSKPYNAIVTTEPLKPKNPIVSSLGTTTLGLKWEPPENSGVDRYHVTYQQTGATPGSTVDVNDLTSTTVDLSEGLFPGATYQFAIYSLKANEASQPALLEVTMKPLSPKWLTIRPDYLQKQFRLTLDLHSINTSLYDQCYLQYLSLSDPENVTMNVSAPISNRNNDAKCDFLLDLVPGTSYEFRAWTLTSDRTPSSMFANRTAIRPAFSSELFGIEVESSVWWLKIKWRAERMGAVEDIWPILVGNGSNLTTEIRGPDDSPSSKVVTSRPGDQLKVGEGFIRSGGCFQLHLYTKTVSGVVSANRARKTSVKVEVMLEKNGTQLIDGSCALNFLTKYSMDGTVEVNQTLIGLNGKTKITLNDLKPYTRYHSTAFLRCGGAKDDSCETAQVELIPLEFETAQGLPGPVRNARITAETPFRAHLNWDVPLQPNGIIESYLVKVYPELNSRLSSEPRSGLPTLSAFHYVEHPWKVTVIGDKTQAQIINLTGGLRYRFDVQARTQAGLGESAANGAGKGHAGTTLYPPSSIPEVEGLAIRMPIWRPPKPRGKPEILVDTIRQSDFSVRFNLSIFSTRNGLLEKYALVVAEGEHPIVESDTILSWFEVEGVGGNKVWPPYLAVEKPLGRQKTLEPRTVTEVLGVDVACKHSRYRQGLCNGPLRAGRRYRVRLRVYTAPDMWTDSEYSELVETKKPNGGKAAALVGGFFLLLVLSVLILGTIHKLVTPVVKPVLKKDFSEHVRLMSADSDFRFSEEYEDLKQVGRNIPCSAADLPCNRNKNRFTNILPFDHSRVKLISIDDEEGSDFINANYIPGYNSPREFIAAQGPLPSTRDDFWRMIWEQQCPAVINLTRCIEKGREKCDQYWPLDSDPVTYGDIEVALMNETRHPDWIMKELKMINLAEPSAPAQYTKHYHYTSWPDFGVPERPQALVQFVRAFRSKVPPDSACKPTIVHCSAGVGRSGTFIAIDHLMQSILCEDTVDIFGITYRMRKERIWMVQTEQQYICIHHSLLCVLEGRENDEPVPSYPLAVPPPVVAVANHGGYTRGLPPPPPLPRPVSPRVEVHQNPAFEDDEGIAESGV